MGHINQNFSARPSLILHVKHIDRVISWNFVLFRPNKAPLFMSIISMFLCFMYLLSFLYFSIFSMVCIFAVFSLLLYRFYVLNKLPSFWSSLYALFYQLLYFSLSFVRILYSLSALSFQPSLSFMFFLTLLWRLSLVCLFCVLCFFWFSLLTPFSHR